MSLEAQAVPSARAIEIHILRAPVNLVFPVSKYVYIADRRAY